MRYLNNILKIILIGTLLCATYLFVYAIFAEPIVGEAYIGSVPIDWAIGKLNEYAAWMEKPYYSEISGSMEKVYAFSAGWAWLLRIASFILILACIALICYGLFQIGLYYKKRWCSLSLRVLSASLIVIVIFGEGIHLYVKINLVVFLILIQVVYLGVLIFMDDYYDSRNKVDYWTRIQYL